MTQDTLLRAFTHLDQYDEHRPFYPWIATIVSIEGERNQIGNDCGIDAFFNGALKRLIAFRANRYFRPAVLDLAPNLFPRFSLLDLNRITSKASQHMMQPVVWFSVLLILRIYDA